MPQPEHGVTTVFIALPNTKIELLEPLGENSPIAKFLESNPDGGMHHICYEVDDIIAARDRLKAEGARVLGDGEPKIGAHGKPVLFLHPKDFCGTLVETRAGISARCGHDARHVTAIRERNFLNQNHTRIIGLLVSFESEVRLGYRSGFWRT